MRKSLLAASTALLIFTSFSVPALANNDSAVCTPSSLVVLSKSVDRDKDFVAGMTERKVLWLTFAATGNAPVAVNSLQLDNLGGFALSIDHFNLRRHGDQQPFATLERDGADVDTFVVQHFIGTGTPLFTVEPGKETGIVVDAVLKSVAGGAAVGEHLLLNISASNSTNAAVQATSCSQPLSQNNGSTSTGVIYIGTQPGGSNQPLTSFSATVIAPHGNQ